MDDMTAPTNRSSSDGTLNINHHTERQVVTAARRRRMEITCLKVVANAGNQNVEPVSKRSRPCSEDVKPSSSSFHVLTITSSSSSSFQPLVDDDEGEGECIPIFENDNIFELPICPSLQQDMLLSSTTVDNGLATSEVEEPEEESSTALSNTSITTKSPQFGSDESSGEICSMPIHNNCSIRSNCSDSEINGAKSPPEPQSVTNTLASPQEESSVAGTLEQELLNNLDLQSMQSVTEIVALAGGDSADLASVVSLPGTSGGESGGNGSGMNSSCVSDNRILPWGCASICGRRAEMEDAMAAVPAFLSVPCGTVGGCIACGSRNSNESSALHFFGVYDGHGGSQAANFCKDRLHHALVEEFEVAMNVENLSTNGNGENNWQIKWERAFADCFHKVDVEVGGGIFRRDSKGEVVVAEDSADRIAPETVGSTAVVAVVGACQIIVSNCGDSRAVLSRGGRAFALSVDHKPDREDELARIEGAGGKVINWNGHRIFGVLAMSRALGDYYLKPYVIPDPEITFTQRTEDDEFLILASDGLWDVLTNEEVCEAVRRRFARGHGTNANSSVKIDVKYPSAQAAAEYLSRLALHRNSRDNVTVVVVDLRARKRPEPTN